MTDYIRFFIPAYFILFFVIAFLGISIKVARRIGKNPIVFPKDDTAYACIGRYFKITLLTLFGYTVLIAWIPDQMQQTFIISFLNIPIVKYIGIALMISALIWTITAQVQMKDSWRIGIDQDAKTRLIIHGLFRFSRNPIFLGMTVSLVGFFLLFPTLIAFLFLTTGSLLMQIQIRLEEEYLVRQHGQIYLAYKKRVARMLILY